MAIVIDKKIYRNIQEQVEKNKRDIAAWSNIQFTLNNFGITVLGRVDAEADIPEGTYSYGDAYLVGETEPYDIYIYTRDGESGEFINMGPLTIVGPKGDKGDQGNAGTITVGTVSAGEPGTNPVITNSGTPQNAILNFTIPRGAKGETGAQGNVGPKGETGERGPIGLTGPQGDPGQSFMIIATITNTSQLPDPTETPRNHAYVYKDGNQLTPDLIYFITGEVGSEVWSYASFAQTGTTVSVNGNPVSAFNADTKIDEPATAGTSGQVLTSDGQGGASWETPSGGGGSATAEDLVANGTVTLCAEMYDENDPTKPTTTVVKYGNVICVDIFMMRSANFSLPSDLITGLPKPKSCFYRNGLGSHTYQLALGLYSYVGGQTGIVTLDPDATPTTASILLMNQGTTSQFYNGHIVYICE